MKSVINLENKKIATNASALAFGKIQVLSPMPIVVDLQLQNFKGFSILQEDITGVEKPDYNWQQYRSSVAKK